MLDPAAISRFHATQIALLASTYNKSWEHGVRSYQPDADPAKPLPQDPGHHEVIAAVGMGAVAMLLHRRGQRYAPPSVPDKALRDRALTPAIGSADKMAAELHHLIPQLAQVQAAEVAIRAGTIDQADLMNYALGLAAREWTERNEWRLGAGESAAWAGEQAGYSQAADADGQLLEWVAEADDRVCEDCESLAAMPPMPLSEWPTLPGMGDTICNVGCRCAVQVSDVQLEPGDSLPELSDDQEAFIGRLASERTEAIEAAIA